MPRSTPILHLLCGKIASGKSTLARSLGEAPRTVVLSEDDWLAALYAGQMASVADYVSCSARLRGAMRPHVVALLSAGVSVVLDFPANTIENRAWMRGIIDETEVRHVLHWLDVPDAVCKARLRQRNAEGGHAFSVSAAQFDRITRHFVPPTAGEAFEVVRHRDHGAR